VVCGEVSLDTATIGFGDPSAFRARDKGAAGPSMGLDPLRAATLGTKEDAEYPVEKLARRTPVNGIRVELVTDLIEVPGVGSSSARFWWRPDTLWLRTQLMYRKSK
jgi:hypothetical protein